MALRRARGDEAGAVELAIEIGKDAAVAPTSERRQACARLARRPAAEPAPGIALPGAIIDGAARRLAELAVIDNVDAELRLMPADLAHRIGQPRAVILGVIRLAIDLGAVHLEQRRSGCGRLPACEVRMRAVLRSPSRPILRPPRDRIAELSRPERRIVKASAGEQVHPGSVMELRQHLQPFLGAARQHHLLIGKGQRRIRDDDQMGADAEKPADRQYGIGLPAVGAGRADRWISSQCFPEHR